MTDTATTIEKPPVADNLVDWCPVCRSHDEGCTSTVCHGLDSD